MEITLGVARGARRRAGWRALRRRPRAHLLSVDDLLRYRLLERLAGVAGARRWPPDDARALPAPSRLPTPDYELLRLEVAAREAEARAARGAAGRDAAAAAGAFMLALAALVLLARALRRCLASRVKGPPIEEPIVAGPELAGGDPPPPYSELPAPPPYCACAGAAPRPRREPALRSPHRHSTLQHSQAHRTDSIDSRDLQILA